MRSRLIKTTYFLLAVIIFGLISWLIGIGFFNLLLSEPPVPERRLVLEGLMEPTEIITKPNIAERPLVVELEAARAEAKLSADGIVRYTNFHRQGAGLVSLEINSKLTRAAERKLQDMLDRSYFDHFAPDGSMGSDELAVWAGYQYLLIGENLAWGSFAGDRGVVEAWMESPGHRENILRARYREIGVAVEWVELQGRTGWLAVQIFGRPRADCPMPASELIAELEAIDRQLEAARSEAEGILEELTEEGADMTRRRFNRLVEAYNQAVEKYNQLIQASQEIIGRYNRQVEAFNQCLKSGG